jgi:hypothetical protein
VLLMAAMVLAASDKRTTEAVLLSAVAFILGAAIIALRENYERYRKTPARRQRQAHEQNRRLPDMGENRRACGRGGRRHAQCAAGAQGIEAEVWIAPKSSTIFNMPRRIQSGYIERQDTTMRRIVFAVTLLIILGLILLMVVAVDGMNRQARIEQQVQTMESMIEGTATAQSPGG